MSQPTIVFVPGLWHSPDCFNQVRALLAEKNYPTDAVSNPTRGPQAGSKTLTDDAANLRTKLEALADEDKEIVLVLHSYGGIVGGCGVEGMELAERQKSRKRGGVIMLVYICALMGVKGVSMMDMMGGKLLPWVGGDEANNTCLPQRDADHFLYHDVEPASEREKAIANLQPTSLGAYTIPFSYEAWRYSPSMYIICKGDKALLEDAQRGVVENARKEGADVTAFECEGSHSPFLSMPDKVVEGIKLAVKLGVEKKTG